MNFVIDVESLPVPTSKASAHAALRGTACILAASLNIQHGNGRMTEVVENEDNKGWSLFEPGKGGTPFELARFWSEPLPVGQGRVLHAQVRGDGQPSNEQEQLLKQVFVAHLASAASEAIILDNPDSIEDLIESGTWVTASRKLDCSREDGISALEVLTDSLVSQGNAQNSHRNSDVETPRLIVERPAPNAFQISYGSGLAVHRFVILDDPLDQAGNQQVVTASSYALVESCQDGFQIFLGFQLDRLDTIVKSIAESTLGGLE